jgi:hypothetical protein
VDLPTDPFLPDDPRFRESPLARDVLEGSQLMSAFVDVPSLSTLAENLRKADHRDLELVALFAIAEEVRDAFKTMVNNGSISTDEAESRFAAWLVGPVSDGTLDDL